MSPPSRAAWIEIYMREIGAETYGSPPSRAAWIEISISRDTKIKPSSPPSRAAWIEIFDRVELFHIITVAAFTGGVD